MDSPRSHCTLCLSEQLIDIQEHIKGLASDIVTEVTEITETDIAKEQKVETEIQKSTESLTVPG